MPLEVESVGLVAYSEMHVSPSMSIFLFSTFHHAAKIDISH